VEQDNSGSSNIFAVEPKNLYVSSPTADKVAQQGLGGSQGKSLKDLKLSSPTFLQFDTTTLPNAGLLLVGGIIGVILLVTLGISRSGGDDLSNLQQSASSLRDIASQF
jgi:hypothetical protein